MFEKCFIYLGRQWFCPKQWQQTWPYGKSCKHNIFLFSRVYLFLVDDNSMMGQNLPLSKCIQSHWVHAYTTPEQEFRFLTKMAFCSRKYDARRIQNARAISFSKLNAVSRRSNYYDIKLGPSCSTAQQEIRPSYVRKFGMRDCSASK